MNTSWKLRCGAALLAVSGAVTGLVGVGTASADTAMTATTSLNVRSGPSTSAKIVGGLYRGQSVAAVSSSSGWTKIRYGGGAAFVASRYLAKKTTAATPIATGASNRVTTASLNLRKGPGLSYAVITVIPEGRTVRLSGTSSRGFAQIVYGSSRGWVSSQYLAASRLPAIIGTRVTTADVMVRTTSGTDYKVVGEITKGSRVSVTGANQNGRAQIVYRNAVRWVTAKYLANAPVTAPVVPGLPAVTGTRWATTALLIRSTHADTFTTLGEVPRGTALSITGVVRNGRMQIVWQKAARWVTAQYLSSTPVSSGGANPYAVEKGLKPNAIQVHRASMARFPQITTYYGVRRDPIPDHPSGRALDLMLPNYKSASGRALGRAVATWARTNARSLGIEYVIWDQHIWNIRRDSEGWRYMADRGGDSANHKNHVHITVFG